MKKIYTISKIVGGAVLSICMNTVSAQKVEVINLKTEYLENPIGIDNTSPRFTWQADADSAVEPSNYQLIVGTDSAAVSNGKGNMWETKKLDAGIQLLEYAGKSLQPFTKYKSFKTLFKMSFNLCLQIVQKVAYWSAK